MWSTTVLINTHSNLSKKIEESTINITKEYKKEIKLYEILKKSTA